MSDKQFPPRRTHWRKRVYKWHGWIVRPLCNVQYIAKEPYHATTFRKDVTCRTCIRIGEKNAKRN